MDDDDERGSVKVDPPGGSQQMTAQHVPDEWKGLDRFPPLPPQFCGRLPPHNFAPGYPRSFLSPAPPELSGR